MREEASHAPARVGAWELGEILGRGGAGVVYAARHAGSGAEGAFKVAHASAGAVRHHWFRREASLAARLRHRHVVALVDQGELDDGRPFLVYERIDGPTLEKEADELDLDALVRLGAELLDALGYAHDAGVVHCDVTPSNVLLAGPARAAKLIDFGLAKARSDARAGRMAAGVQVSGTPGYLSPEQARGAGSPGPASDLFGAGAVLFRCLTGYAPYGGDTAMAVVQLTLTSSPLPLRPRDGLRAPMKLAQVVQRLLARDPEHRYPSAARARRAWLEAAASHTPVRGALRPRLPSAPGLQSMETILVDPLQSSRAAARPQFSTVRATPSAGFDRRMTALRTDESRAFGRRAALARALRPLGGAAPAGTRAERSTGPLGEVAITGARGLGKSDLLAAARAALRDAGTRVCFARGRQSGLCAPFEALAGLLLDAIGASALAPVSLAAERLAAALVEADAPALAGARDTLIGGLLGVGPTGATGSAVMEAFGAAEALLDPDRRPVVLVLDDADGVDEGTWEVLGNLRHRPDGGVGLLWAARERAPAEGVAHLVLSTPSDEALDEAWADWVGARVPRPEAVRAPADLRAHAAAARLSGEADLDTLLGVLEAPKRALLEAAATFGGDVPERGLPRVAEGICAPTPVGEAAMDTVLRSRLLVEVDHAAGRRERWLRMPSAALRARVLARLSGSERARRAALAAQWLARECMDEGAPTRARIASLALDAELPASAAHALGEAGRIEVEAGRPRAAAPYFARALALSSDGAREAVDRPRLLAWLAQAALASGRPAEADAHAADGEAAVEPERAVLRAQLALTRAEASVQRNRLDEAVAHLHRALAELGEDGDPVELARSHASLGWVLGYRLGRNEEGIAHGLKALDVAARIRAPAFRASLCGKLGANYLRAGDWDGQLETNREDLRLSTRARDVSGIVRAHINLGVCFHNRGLLALAREHTESARALAERTGVAGAAQIAHNNLAMIALDDGRLDDLSGHAAAVLEAAERTGYRRALPETRLTLARAALARGDLTEAARSLARAEDDADVADQEVAHRVHALIALARGEPARALDCAAALVASPEHDPYERAASRLTHAAALRATGRLEAAEAEEATADRVFWELGADPALERRRWGARSG
ncbi:MAG TPA: protein kinase [Sandaracinaceae bacterium LLY-WYZ-13_1]|nr:protein kinase [Sandaracinaceae bacterium LLY-WYZ-13_1]